MEDAGFVIHPFVLNWYQVQGFPKATQVKAHAGHYYGGQVMRNCIEPILVFQKPGKRLQELVAQTGAGSLNVDAARQPAKNKRLKQKYDSTHGHRHGGQIFVDKREKDRHPNVDGYWPMNVALTCQPGCEERLHKPGCVVLRAIEQTSIETAAAHFQATWEAEMLERLGGVDGLSYFPKATRYERDVFLEHLPTREFRRVNPGGLENEKRFAPTTVHNFHPTVKPMGLTTWLAALLLPPEQFKGRLLNPFSGSGTEAIGGVLAGWDEVVGIEQDGSFAELANERMKGWQGFVQEHGARAVRQAIKERQLRQLVGSRTIEQQPLFQEAA